MFIEFAPNALFSHSRQVLGEWQKAVNPTASTAKNCQLQAAH
jgi:hypothetical protein